MTANGFLKTVLDTTRQGIDQRKKKRSLSDLRNEAEKAPDRPDFLAAMARGSREDVGIIAEIKKASPSKGDIRPNLDPNGFAKAYEKAGARAVSVLTEPHFFKGSLDDLKTAASAVNLPVLRKEFIISSYQIYEAKFAGASAVLLITTLLSPDQQTDYTALVRELDMEPLVEINSEKEFEQAHKGLARVVGINNRNLATLEVDPDAARRIAAIFPREIIPVAASGISCRGDVEKGTAAGLFNFLVGESIVRAQDTVAFIRSLRGENKEQ